MIILPVALILAAYPAGLLGIKFGRERTMMTGLIGICVTSVFLVIYGVLPKSLLVFEISFVFLGIFWAFININSIVVVWALAPEGKTGAYTGNLLFL